MQGAFLLGYFFLPPGGDPTARRSDSPEGVKPERPVNAVTNNPQKNKNEPRISNPLKILSVAHRPSLLCVPRPIRPLCLRQACHASMQTLRVELCLRAFDERGE
jgi:hypothetical protein